MEGARGDELLVILADPNPNLKPAMLLEFLKTKRVDHELVDAADVTPAMMDRAAGALLFGLSAWPAEWPRGVAWEQEHYVRIVEHALKTGLKMRIWGPAFEAVMYLFGGQVRRTAAEGGERRGAIELPFDNGDYPVMVATRHVVTTAAIGFDAKLVSPGTFHPPIVEVAVATGGRGVVGASFRAEMSDRGRQMIMTFVELCKVRHGWTRASPAANPSATAWRGSAWSGYKPTYTAADFRRSPSPSAVVNSSVRYTNQSSTKTDRFRTIEEWKAHFAEQEREAQALEATKRALLLGHYPPRTDDDEEPEVIEVPATASIQQANNTSANNTSANNTSVADALRDAGDTIREGWWDYDAPVPTSADVGPDDEEDDPERAAERAAIEQAIREVEEEIAREEAANNGEATIDGDSSDGGSPEDDDDAWATERDAIEAAVAEDSNVEFRSPSVGDQDLDPVDVDRRWKAFCERRYPALTDGEREILGIDGYGSD